MGDGASWWVVPWSSAWRLAVLRGRGTEGEKPLWSRHRGVVPDRARLRKEARVVVQGARVL
jgi:hypothetical protein